MAISSQILAQGPGRSLNRHRGMAFLIEALVVLAFLMTSLAVFVRLFSGAQLEGMQANRLSQAVLAATNGAEKFSADPAGAQDFTTNDGLSVTYDVTEGEHAAGVLYSATITVSDGAEEVYVLRTARYVSDADAAGGAGPAAGAAGAASEGGAQ